MQHFLSSDLMMSCWLVILLVPWLQPVSEAVLAVVTSLTLVVLIKYAVDTSTIAKNSTMQLENSYLPFIALVMLTDPDRSSNWAMKNQGNGTALNICYTRYLPSNQPPIRQWMTPLAPGESYSLPKENDHQMYASGFDVEYESISGARYRTTVDWIDGGPKTKFSAAR
jgi:hypothetical protein